MKKHLILTSLVAIVAATGAVRADDITIDSIKASLESSAITTPAPDASIYTYTLANGTTANLTAETTADDYTNYIATSAAVDNEYIELVAEAAVKLGEVMSASSYKYSSKNADGEITMVTGDTAVTGLSKVYESTYGNITVSTESEPVVNIANYVSGEYSLHEEEDGSIVLYQNGALELDSPEMFATLKGAYDADKAGVAALKETLDDYKEYNTINHNAIADIAATDNETIAGIAANKATWETASANYTADTTAYNTAVANYNGSLGKVVDDKVASGSVEAIVANAKIAEVTEPAPDASIYTYTLANGESSDMSNEITPDYAGYIAASAADGTLVALAEGTEVKLGETMSASSYKYSSKNADGEITMVTGDTAVTGLSKVYESTYGNITVSTESEPVVNIANYVSGEYSLHEEEDGSIVLYQNGALELDSPEMFATLKGAYDADKAGVAALKETLDDYKEYNTINHNAIADIAATDNETIAGIAANKATWETASANYTADTTAYNTAVANYENSLSKVVNDKIATEASRVDAVMGTIHGLISEESSANRQTTNGKSYSGNLAVGTTVEDHLLALDSTIGDRDTLNGEHVIAGESVVANLQSLNDGLESEAQTRADEDAAIRRDFAAADAQLQQQINANIANADALTLSKANSYTDAKVNTLEKNISGGVAAATALSAVEVSNVKKGEMSVGGGYGYYNSQSAMAFGAAMGLSDNWSVNAGAGIASGDKTQVSFRAGTNYKFKLF